MCLASLHHCLLACRAFPRTSYTTSAVAMRAALISALTLLVGVVAAQDDTSCDSGLHIIVARGTGEDEGTGVTGELGERIADRIDGSSVEALDYPATFSDPSYFESVANGTEELRETIEQYHESCPEGKIAVLGYSQVRWSCAITSSALRHG